jgi:DNA-binding response OmpR family regulator
MREALSRAGYRADVYGDSRMVLEDHATSGHSFLILQGDEAGTDAVRLIRRRIGEIPVILLTGAPSKADLAAGSVGHLSTPFTLRTLQAAIARAVD